MRFPRLGVVYRKEIRDAVRDRRSIFSLVFSALVGPLLIAFLFTRIAERQRSAEDVQIPVVGAANAPAFVDWLRQQSGVEVTEGPPEPEKSVRERKHDLVLIIDKEFSKKFARSLPAPVKLVSDATRDTARPKVRRVRQLLQSYSGEIATLRLMSRGISPAVATAIQVDDVEVSSSQQRAAMILAFLPMFVVLSAFVGGMQVATDSTAGERERGSLEPLLLNPVPRASIAGGKWLAASTFGACSVVFTTLLCTLILQRIPLHDLGARFRFGPFELGGILLATLPVAFLSSALQMFISVFARSFKEAQSYLGMLVLIPMLPGILASIYPLSNQPWLTPVPILGQYVILTDVLGGRPPGAILFALSGVCTFVVSVVFIWLTTRMLHRERIIFGR